MRHYPVFRPGPAHSFILALFNLIFMLAGNGAWVRVENVSVLGSQVFYPYYLSGASADLVKTTNSSVFFGGQISVQKSVHVVFSVH